MNDHVTKIWHKANNFFRKLNFIKTHVFQGTYYLRDKSQIVEYTIQYFIFAC